MNHPHIHCTIMVKQKKSKNDKRNSILKSAKRLFLSQGYHKTTIRQIVNEAHTSTGNFYFYFSDKLSVLKIIAKEFITILRNQVEKVKNLDLSPEIGFAYDFRLGYIKTLEDQRLSQLWHIIKNTPEIHKYSLQNKRIRLQTFFGDRILANELNILAIAIQGISDAISQQKREGTLCEDPIILSNAIVEYSLRLLGFSQEDIKNTIKKVDELIEENHDVLKELEEYYEF